MMVELLKNKKISNNKLMDLTIWIRWESSIRINNSYVFVD
jgi:hypothetical protein